MVLYGYKNKASQGQKHKIIKNIKFYLQFHIKKANMQTKINQSILGDILCLQLLMIHVLNVKPAQAYAPLMLFMSVTHNLLLIRMFVLIAVFAFQNARKKPLQMMPMLMKMLLNSMLNNLKFAPTQMINFFKNR